MWMYWKCAKNVLNVTYISIAILFPFLSELSPNCEIFYRKKNILNVINVAVCYLFYHVVLSNMYFIFGVTVSEKTDKKGAF